MTHPLSTNWSGGFGNEVCDRRPYRFELIAQEAKELKKETTTQTPTNNEDERQSTPGSHE